MLKCHGALWVDVRFEIPGKLNLANFGPLHFCEMTYLFRQYYWNFTVYVISDITHRFLALKNCLYSLHYLFFYKLFLFLLVMKYFTLKIFSIFFADLKKLDYCEQVFSFRFLIFSLLYLILNLLNLVYFMYFLK